MVKKGSYSKTCNYCGNNYTVTTRSDDGYDWSGHHRGDSSYEESGGCNCNIQELLTKIKIKRMCLNCTYNEYGYCTNNKIIEEFKESTSKFDFDLGNVSKLKIKKELKVCKNHTFNYNLIQDIFIK